VTPEGRPALFGWFEVVGLEGALSRTARAPPLTVLGKDASLALGEILLLRDNWRALTRAEEGRMLTVGIGWYNREDWEEIKRLCSGLDDTYDEWLSGAEFGAAMLTAEGYKVERVVVTPQDIRDRRGSSGRRVGSKDRAAMVTEKLRKATGSSVSPEPGEAAPGVSER
jgi:hypothetical protein